MYWEKEPNFWRIAINRWALFIAALIFCLFLMMPSFYNKSFIFSSL